MSHSHDNNHFNKNREEKEIKDYTFFWYLNNAFVCDFPMVEHLEAYLEIKVFVILFHIEMDGD